MAQNYIFLREYNRIYTLFSMNILPKVTFFWGLHHFKDRTIKDICKALAFPKAHYTNISAKKTCANSQPHHEGMVAGKEV
jgi:hypothetical protein